MYLLGVDLGTTGCKSMVFSSQGDILGSDYIEYDLILCPRGFIEQDADLWWENIKKSVKNAVKNAGICGKRILSLSISSQGISFVPVDKNGNTLMHAISWLDGRAVEEAEAIAGMYGAQQYFNITGKPVLPAYVMPKLMWIKKHLPEIYENTWKFMMGHDFLLYRLTGRAATDYSMASGTLSYHLADQVWFNGVFEKFNIDVEKLPELGCLGDIAGSILPGVAEELGLSAGTLAVMGAQDQKCAAIGAGIDKEILTVSLGTSTAICSLCSKPLLDPERKVTCCGLDKNHWILESVIATSGVALKWVKNNFFKGMPYGELDSLASSAPAGCNGVSFHPHFENNGSGSRGAFTGLGIHSTQAELIRAVLEGISFQIRIHVEAHERLNGHMKQIRLFGGGAASNVWAQIIADITEKTVVLPRTHETANLGAAMIAGIGAGLYGNYREASGMIGTAAASFTSSPENYRIYSSLFQKYRNRDEKIHND